MMIKFDILNRWTGAVQFTAEIDCADDTHRSIKVGLAVSWGVENRANLHGAKLYGANLVSASLYGASLVSASLYGASLDGAHGINDWIKCIQIDTYPITYTSDVMQISCQRHPISDWSTFTDAQIRAMGGTKALAWWMKYKAWIFATIEMCPAKQTKAVV
jgi:hypothetical protein